MKLDRLGNNWDELAKADPLWAILTRPDKKDNKWQIEEFFDTGRKNIADIMNYVGSIDMPPLRRKRALDFGCGIGRLTQALADYFDEVDGVDIAPTMIELAQRYNLKGDRCKYHVNRASDLKLFPDNHFDFIYTLITLQHMKPRYARGYMKEFIRTLAPNGLIIFQLPSEYIGPRNLPTNKFKRRIVSVLPKPVLDVYCKIRYFNRRDDQPRMEMYGIKLYEAVRFLERSGARIIDIKRSPLAGKNWVSYQYCVTKK
jgi:ubiquinone/menaquinone biosynthesis C-methylase UbiE